MSEIIGHIPCCDRLFSHEVMTVFHVLKGCPGLLGPSEDQQHPPVDVHKVLASRKSLFWGKHQVKEHALSVSGWN